MLSNEIFRWRIKIWYLTFFLLFFCHELHSEEKAVVLNIHSVEQLSLENNFELKTSNLKKRILLNNKTEAFRRFLPQFGIGYSKSILVAKRNLDSRSHRINLELSQPIYDGGKTFLNYQQNRISLLLHAREYENIRQQLIVKVRMAYYDVLRYFNQLHIIELSLERTRVQLGHSLKEYELGMITKLDLLELEIKLREMELQNERSKKEYELKLLELLQVIGLPSDSLVKISDFFIDLFPLYEKDLTADVLIESAFANRYEVFQKKLSLSHARLSYKFAKSFFLPTFSLTANYSFSGEKFPPRERSWSIGFVISSNLYGSSFSDSTELNSSNNDYSKGYSTQNKLGLFDNIGFQGKILQSRLNLEKSLEEQKNLTQSIRLDVKKKMAVVFSNYEIQKLAYEKKELLNSKLLIEVKKVELGQLKRLELIKTEEELLRAKTEYNRAKIEYISSVNQLEISGGLALDSLGLFRIADKVEARE